MKYCNNCGQNVIPEKKFSVVWFLINCLWLVGGIVYIIYFIFMKKKVCPICHGSNLEREHDINEVNNALPVPTTIEIYQDKLDKAIAKNEEAKAKYETAKETTAETIRKRKAGELPWQIKAAEKKAAKEQKKLSKV